MTRSSDDDAPATPQFISMTSPIPSQGSMLSSLWTLGQPNAGSMVGWAPSGQPVNDINAFGWWPSATATMPPVPNGTNVPKEFEIAASGDLPCQACPKGGSYGTTGMYSVSGRVLCPSCAAKALGVGNAPASEQVKTMTPFLLRTK